MPAVYTALSRHPEIAGFFQINEAKPPRKRGRKRKCNKVTPIVEPGSNRPSLGRIHFDTPQNASDTRAIGSRDQASRSSL
jgi:hypothetical protein